MKTATKFLNHCQAAGITSALEAFRPELAAGTYKQIDENFLVLSIFEDMSVVVLLQRDGSKELASFTFDELGPMLIAAVVEPSSGDPETEIAKEFIKSELRTALSSIAQERLEAKNVH